MPDTIHRNIKSLREIKGYSQDYMALCLHMTQAGYSRIENGGGRMSFEKLEQIAAIFEMDLQSVIHFGDSPLQAVSFQSAGSSCAFYSIIELYRDKIALLEKLLLLTESDLNRCREQYGPL